jgi:ferredoxin
MAQVDDGESILDAALDDGLDVPHDCKMGVCMTCPAKLLSGQVDHGVAMLSDDVIEQGFALLCTAIPMGDVVVKVVDEVGCVCWPPACSSSSLHLKRGDVCHLNPDQAGEPCNVSQAPCSHVWTEPARLGAGTGRLVGRTAARLDALSRHYLHNQAAVYWPKTSHYILIGCSCHVNARRTSTAPQLVTNITHPPTGAVPTTTCSCPPPRLFCPPCPPCPPAGASSLQSLR